MFVFLCRNECFLSKLHEKQMKLYEMRMAEGMWFLAKAIFEIDSINFSNRLIGECVMFCSCK